MTSIKTTLGEATLLATGNNLTFMIKSKTLPISIAIAITRFVA